MIAPSYNMSMLDRVSYADLNDIITNDRVSLAQNFIHFKKTEITP